METYFNCKTITLYSYNGSEYHSLAKLLAAHVISHLTNPPHTPEHNGYSIRRHRHIVEACPTTFSCLSKVLNIGYQNRIGWRFSYRISDIGGDIGDTRAYRAFISDTIYNEILIIKSWFRFIVLNIA